MPAVGPEALPLDGARHLGIATLNPWAGRHRMIVWICTDMEGLAGVDHWDQCYAPDDDSPIYQHGLQQLAADTNAAVAGCFDAGATEVRVLDGHGRNRGQGFLPDRLDPRARLVRFDALAPLRMEALDGSVQAVAMMAHAMAGTLHAFLDHTQSPKTSAATESMDRSRAR